MNASIQKLAIIFLVVAILTSSLALGISSFINRSPVVGTTAAGQTTETTEAERAFMPVDPAISGGGPNGRNLTDEVTGIVAEQIVNRNPEGPKTAEDGSVSLMLPYTDEVSSFLAKNSPPIETLTPALDEHRIQTIQDFNINDVSHYFSLVSQIQSDLSSNSLWQATLTTSTASAAANENWISAAERVLTDARDDVYAVKVPAPFLSLHKSFLAFLDTNASFAQVALHDPVAAAALAKSLDGVLAQETAAMEKAAKDLQSNYSTILSQIPAEDRPLLAKIFAVNVAHATIPTIDWAHIGTTIASWAKDFAHWLADHWKGILLGQLKNILIQKLSQKVITWAQGHGVPGYVVNWLSFQVGAALAAREGTIGRKTAELCGNAATEGLYGDILASALNSPSRLRGVNRTVGDNPRCRRLDIIDPHASDRDKSVRRWGNYLDSLVNNPMNALLEVRDRAAVAAAELSQAAVHEALSGRGSLDVKKCDDGTAVDMEGLCFDGKPARTITQGSTKQDLVSKAVDNTFDTISVANNPDLYESLVSAIANALLTRALEEGAGLFESGNRGTAPTPATTPQGQISQYASVLERALANENQAVSNLDGAIEILGQNTGDVCSEDVVASATALANDFREVETPIKARRDRIQSLLTALSRITTVAQLTSQIGTLQAMTDLATQAEADATAAGEALLRANDVLQSCSS